jgi:hypothetical protein
MKTTQPSHVGGLWGNLEVALLPPLGEHPVAPLSVGLIPVAPLRVGLIAAGADPVLGLAAPQCLAPTVGLDDFVTPEVQGLGQIPIGQDGCPRAALGGAGLRMADWSIRLHPPRLQPRAEALQQGPLLKAYTQHGQPPGVVQRVEAALDIGLPQSAIASVLPSAGEGADRLHRAASGARAVTALQTIVRLDGRHQLRPGQWHPLLFACRYASWPVLTVGRGPRTASAPLGPIALRFQALSQCLHVGLQVHGILLGRDVSAPTGSGRVPGIPAGAEQGRIPAPIPIPQPVWRVRACCVGYPPQAGGLLWRRSARVRQQFPGRAAACRHGLPPVVGLPHR